LALVLGRDGAEQDRPHVAVLGQAVEGFLQHGQLLGPAAARRGPAQAHDPVRRLELFELVGEDFQAGWLANLGVLEHLQGAKLLLAAFLIRDIRNVDSLDRHRQTPWCPKRQPSPGY
jgi:hypothetical protein